MHLLGEAGLPIPEPLRRAAESVLGARFEAEIARQRRSRDPSRYRRAIKMAEDARERGLTLHRAEAQRTFAETLCDLVASIRARPTTERIGEARQFLALGDQLGLETVSPRAQEQLWTLLATTPARTPELDGLAVTLGFARSDGARVEPATGEADNAIDPATRTRPAPRAA